MTVCAALALVVAASLMGCGSSDAGDAVNVAVVDAAAEVEAATPLPFTLSSPAFREGGALPVDYACDGAGRSPPLAWSGTPEATAELAVMMTTVALDGLKWNWVLYGIAPSVTSLDEATAGVGTAGLTSDGPALAYAPPCSQGPGAKAYTFTAYALSAAPALVVSADRVTGAVLTSSLEGLTLATSSMTVTYTRR